MQLPEPRLHLVADPSDRPEHIRFVKSLADPAAGRVVCEIRPGARGNLAWLAETVLQGLGKRADRAGHGRNAQLSWRRAIVWSVTTDVRHLFVNRSHLLHFRDIEDLIDLAALTNADLWLIVQGERLPRPAREALALLPLRRWSYPAFHKHWQSRLEKREQPGLKARRAKRRMPRYQLVPDDEFPTFLASCDELLPAAEVKAIEIDLNTAAERTEEWLADTRAIEAAALAGFLLKLVETLPSRGAMVVALRAAQIVLFEHGYLLKVDVDRLLAKRGSIPDLRRAPEFAKLTSTYASTSFPAEAALCLLLGDLAPDVIPNLDVGSVSADGATLQIPTDNVDAPEALRLFLRAQRLHRLFEGASDTEPLFVSEERTAIGGQRPLRRRNWHSTQQAVRKVARETGMPLVLAYNGTCAAAGAAGTTASGSASSRFSHSSGDQRRKPQRDDPQRRSDPCPSP